MRRSRTIKKLQVVALTQGKPKLRLLAGQVGTVVEGVARNVFEVEFSDDRGRAYATTAVPASDLLVFRYRRERAA